MIYSSLIFRHINLQNNETIKLTRAPVAAMMTVFKSSEGLTVYNSTNKVPPAVQDNVSVSRL